MCDAPMALGNEEPTSYRLGIRTSHVKDGSTSSHLFLIIKATHNSCACFGWDTQACIHATGKKDVSSKWVSKYASDLERSYLSNSTKTDPQVRQLHLDQGCMSQILTLRQFSSENGSPLSSTGNKFLSTNVSNWSYIFPHLSTDQFRFPVWPTPCPQ